jgi:hypothetical protein
MTGSPFLRRRVAVTLTTPGGTGCTAGVDAPRSTTPQQPDAVVHRLRCDREQTDE